MTTYDEAQTAASVHRGQSHGWTPLGVATDGGVLEWSARIDERYRCICRVVWPHCANRATQEDLRCDFCRECCP